MADAYKELVNWAGGVVSSMPPDQIPDEAIPQGVNTAFLKVGGGKTGIGTRPGLKTVNTTALSSSQALHWQHVYSYSNGTGYNNYLVTCTTDGKLYYKNSDDTYTSALAPPANFPSPSSLCFSSGDNPVDGTVLSNRLFLLNSNGEKRSLVNQTYVPWGLSPIATWTTADNSGGSSSMPNETYDVTITSYNLTSGGESSSATFKSQALASSNHRIEVTITPTSAELAQYTHWRVFIRRQTTQAKLYQVFTLENSGGTSIVTDGNIPIATTTVYVDLSAAQIAALTTEAPSTTENNGPPTKAKNVITFGRRLIVSDGQKIYWSKQDRGDNFSPTSFEPIETGEGDEVRGMHPYSDELLLIFMSTAIWGIFGNDPQTWAIKPVDLTVGITSHNSIVPFEGRVGWWDPAIGPVYYDGSQITRIGLLELGPSAVTSDLNQSRAAYVYAGHEHSGYRVIWATSSIGSSTNDRLFVYNYQLNRFEASYWNAIDAASLCATIAADGSQRLYLGGYYGQSFYFDRLSKNDGVPSGTTKGTFLPTTTSVSTLSVYGVDAPYLTQSASLAATTITVSSTSGIIDGSTLIIDTGISFESVVVATNGVNQTTKVVTLTAGLSYSHASGTSFLVGTGFYNTGSKLVGRKVVVVDDEGRPVDKKRITSNDATTLTLDSAVTGLNKSTTYTFYVGSPDFRFFGKWIDHEQPFLRKRYDWFYLHLGSDTNVADTVITSQLEFNTASAQTTSTSVSGGALWDVSKWDSAKWGAGNTLKLRIPIARNATAARPVVYCFTPGRDIVVYKVAMLSRLLSDRYYG